MESSVEPQHETRPLCDQDESSPLCNHMGKQTKTYYCLSHNNGPPFQLEEGVLSGSGNNSMIEYLSKSYLELGSNEGMLKL